MTKAWTGAWPKHRHPAIGSKGIQLRPENSEEWGKFTHYAPEQQFWVQLDYSHPDEDSVTVTWELRNDASDNPATGGRPEPATKPIEGSIVQTEGNRALIKLPSEARWYRVHAYAVDSHGNAATVSQGVVVE
jgi:hypothetical protein